MLRKLLPFLPIVIILLFAFSLRWWHISSVAPGISNDELGYTLTAKSFFLTGTDLGSTITPLSVLFFKYPTTDPIQAELPYLLHLPFDGPFPFSLPLQRLPYVLMSVATVLLLYLVAKELFGKRTGIIAGIVASTNPYLLVVGRTTYEVVPAIFFYILALYLLLKARGVKILLILPVLFCAFYAYIGTKVAFLPFVLLLSLFGFFLKEKKDRKYYVLLFLLSIIFVGFYFVMLHTNNSGVRLGELLTPNSPQIVSQVDAIRQTSLPTPFSAFFVNKYTIYLTTVINSFLTIFSTSYLFQNGDDFFRIYTHGVLYYVDGLFLLLGLIFLSRKKKAYGILLVLFCIIATIPQILHTDKIGTTNYAHSTLLFPFLVLIISEGIGGIISVAKRPLFRKIVILGIGLLYIVSFLFFARVYFFRYPLAGKEDFSARILSRYAVLAGAGDKHVYILSPSSKIIFKKYLFYANELNKNTISDVKQDFARQQIVLNNTTFASCTSTYNFPKNAIVIEDVLCGNMFDKPHTKIPLVVDGGTAYAIYQDSICSGYTLKQFPYNLTLSNFAVENLGKKAFCETFITK